MVQKSKMEFSDHIVWLGDIYFIFEVKDRLPNESGDDVKWFKKKVLDKAYKATLTSTNQVSGTTLTGMGWSEKTRFCFKAIIANPVQPPHAPESKKRGECVFDLWYD